MAAAGCPMECEELWRFGFQSTWSRKEEGGCGWHKCWLTGTWAEGTREWAGSNAEMSGGEQTLWQMCCFEQERSLGVWDEKEKVAEAQGFDLEAEAQRNLPSSRFSFHKLCLC